MHGVAPSAADKKIRIRFFFVVPLWRPCTPRTRGAAQCWLAAVRPAGTLSARSFPAAVTESSFLSGSVPWCQVAYWEGRERVGRLYPVCSSSLNIMGDTPHGDGLSLASLAAHSPTSPSDQVKRTREKIGLGKSLCVSFSARILSVSESLS